MELTAMQQKVIRGLKQVESKGYTLKDIVTILKTVYQELRVINDTELEEMVSDTLN